MQGLAQDYQKWATSAAHRAERGGVSGKEAAVVGAARQSGAD